MSYITSYKRGTSIAYCVVYSYLQEGTRYVYALAARRSSLTPSGPNPWLHNIAPLCRATILFNVAERTGVFYSPYGCIIISVTRICSVYSQHCTNLLWSLCCNEFCCCG